MTQNILSYALSNDCKIGFSSGTFPGNSYTEELPDEGIKYGTWEITKRSQNTITIKVFSPYKSTMWVNSYVNTAGWNGWKQMVVNTDLFSVHFIAQTLNGYVEYFDARIKSDMNCVASIKYSGVVLNYILNVQVHNGSFIIYVRTPEGTIPQDNTNINIYAIFAK